MKYLKFMISIFEIFKETAILKEGTALTFVKESINFQMLSATKNAHMS